MGGSEELSSGYSAEHVMAPPSAERVQHLRMSREALIICESRQTLAILEIVSEFFSLWYIRLFYVACPVSQAFLLRRSGQSR